MLKKFFILVIILNSFALGQVTSADAVVTVNMLSPLSIATGAGNLDFGEIVLAGSPVTKTIQPVDGQVFNIIGQPNLHITITYNSVTLTNTQWVSLYGGTIGNIAFVPNVESSDFKKVTSGKQYKLSNKGSIGTLDLIVGGTITVAANQPQGDYTGLFTITVSY
jgi:Domain of unknown function (DUF4402)